MLSVVTMAQDFRDYGGKNYESEENFLTYERAIQDFNQALQYFIPSQLFISHG